MINTGTNTVKATVQVGYGPVDVAIASNGATAYVAAEFAHWSRCSTRRPTR